MPNIYTGKVQPKDADFVSVGVSSVQVVPERYTRAGLTLVNISSNNIFLSLNGSAAVMYKGDCLVPNSTWNMDDFSFTNGSIYAIASGANSTLTIQEYINGPE